MDKKFQFTQARIRDLPEPEKGRVDYHDLKVPRLTCRVSSTGNKSFVVLKWNGKTMQRVTVGKYPTTSVSEAQNKAREILTAINNGIDPTAEKRKKELASTVLVDVLEQYLDERDLKPYTIKDYRYKLKLGFEAWLKKPVNEITEGMVLKRHKEISQQKGKTTANTTMRVLRLTLNYAHAIGMVGDNPTSILSKARLWHKNNRKDRVIPNDQLKAWHEAVENLPNYKAQVYMLMMVYMGFRSTEALTMEWSHVSLKAKTITLIDTKNSTNHMLPIPEVLISYIETLHELSGTSKWVFPGDNTDKPMWLPKKPIDAVIQASGVEFSPHDCRRTFATIAEAVSLPMSMIKRLMNHVTTNDVTGGYIITEEATLRDAINKVADYIQARVTQKDNIVQLHHSK
ncbi:MAG: DUF4102 domain-containing protein [Methylococcaceae bacterium]|nr:DUF4102 domain-containing protein [Methylococcaceae bacterium]